MCALQDFWAKRGCLIVQPYNSEVGAGTYNLFLLLKMNVELIAEHGMSWLLPRTAKS